MHRFFGRAALAAALLASTAQAQTAPPAPSAGPVTIESYYRIKWGSEDEFKALYNKNHRPLLMEMQKQGRIKSVRMEVPFTHMAGGPRWDMRVTITYPDAVLPVDVTGPFEAAWQAAEKRLYPDSAAFKAAEAKRFSLLEEHWDVIVMESTTQ